MQDMAALIHLLPKPPRLPVLEKCRGSLTRPALRPLVPDTRPTRSRPPRRIWPAALGPMQRCSECRTLARKRAAAAGVVGCAALPACCMNPSPQRPQPLSQPELCGQAVPTPPARRPCFSWPLEMIASALRRRSAYSGRPSPYGVVV